MEEEVEAGAGRSLGARTVAGLAAVSLMCGGILYNALIAGPGRPGLAVMPEGATTKLVVDAGDGAPLNTITLSYDPLVEEAQRELAALGLYAGPVDGVAGKRTKQAIESYEQQNGLQITGLAAESLIEHMRYTRTVADASRVTGSVSAPADPEPDPEVKRVQTSLAELGYDPGEADGALGDKTREAIKQFETDRGLSPKGEISEDMMGELAKLAGQSAAE